MLNDFVRELELIETWMKSSGIQNCEKNNDNFGGVHAWYDLNEKSFAFLYSEITGYAVTWYISKYSSTNDPVWLENAVRAADWLIEKALDSKNGGVLCRHDGEKWRRLICSFDNGMCLNGLCNVYRHTGDEKYLQAAKLIGKNLTENLQRPDGSFFSKYDVEQETANDPGGKWSLISGPFLVKLSIGLLNLAETTGDAVFSDSAFNLCQWGLKFQSVDGRFMTSPNEDETFLHPHCYAAEGLLVAGIVLNNEEFVNSAAKAVEWIAERQFHDGTFPAYYKGGSCSEETSPDMTAQVIRLWGMLPPSARPNINIEKAIRSILNLQCLSDDAAARGGIFAGDAWFVDNPKPSDTRHTHINSWVSMFSSQAIALVFDKQFNCYHLV